MSDPHEPRLPPGVLFRIDVARIWTQEAQKAKPGREPLRPETVSSYLKESRSETGRYWRNPAPMPDGYAGHDMNLPWWKAGREQELRDWWNSRLGQGHGTGGPRAGGPPRKRNPRQES